MNEMMKHSVAARFGIFEVDLLSREIRKRGMRMRLEEKPFRILELLLASPGKVVSRTTFHERLWPDAHVGFEHSLNTAVNKLRGLLGDSAQSPRFIETVPRRGYRFIAPVERPSHTPMFPGRKMLAVLPLDGPSSAPGLTSFADGLTEELTSQIGQLDPKRLGVIARSWASRYKGTNKSAGEVAGELKADYVLEGSVRQEGMRIRITAQLIEAHGQGHVWSATYDGELRDVLGLQQEVAQNVSRAIASGLTIAERPIAEDALPNTRESEPSEQL
jgi:TolB-like protein